MRVALCQIPVSTQPAVNLSRDQSALTSAREQGSDLAVFPEGNTGEILRRPPGGRGTARRPVLHRACPPRPAAAASPSLPESSNKRRTIWSTTRPSPIDSTGQLVAAYRKIHLFDALGTRESETIAPGSEPVIAELAGLKVGFLTCYDVQVPRTGQGL